MSDANAICQPEEKPVEFRDIPGYPGYRACSDGHIWSSRTRGHASHVTRWHKLSPYIKIGGYKIVALMKDGKQRSHSVHRLVLLAFVGPPPHPKMHGCHSNCDPADCRPSNLRWDTAKGNIADTVAAGRICHGSANRSAKFTEDEIVQIRTEYSEGKITISDIAKRENVTHETITRIVKGLGWVRAGGPITPDTSGGYRLGGIKGGTARALVLSPSRRSEIGRMGAAAANAKLDEQRRK